MDLRVGGHIRVQEVSEVDFDASAEVVFPLKERYDEYEKKVSGRRRVWNMDDDGLGPSRSDPPAVRGPPAGEDPAELLLPPPPADQHPQAQEEHEQEEE